MTNEKQKENIDPRPALSEFESWWRRKLPVWLQWVLCWPCSAISAVLLTLILSMNFSKHDDFGCVTYIIKFLYPAIVFSIFLWLFWSMVPRGKYELCIVFLTLRSLLLIALIAVTIAKFLDLDISREWMPMDYKWWLQVAAEVIALIVGIVTVTAMKREYDKQNREQFSEIVSGQVGRVDW